ncbi:hypothetical protein PAAG_00172 [Paracoccidioides lutzii Pb01]|uniref:Uncharacterized protein n=1 Tax=Paracoccidioides lutzii (strain ATCC MYA-826 / Pb01) TaxID=502779 RepID=C1GNS7_PARBA|nr:hypothetical protein PAAG_00172 [Paracoccidioides lutzii Pb01]EEH35849.2 hypothetical protein PAAG_00172 [Paracoccidioides lutzii Pb01]
MPSKGSTTASPPTPASTPRSSSESSIERLKSILHTAKKPSPADAKPSPKSKAVTMEARAVSLPATTRWEDDAFLRWCMAFGFMKSATGAGGLASPLFLPV